VAALYVHWAEWPPANEAMRLAWFKTTEGKKTPGKKGSEQSDEERAASNAANIARMAWMPGVGPWQGPPPFTPQQVAEMAERAKKELANG
jgi:hypothetical protein